MTELVSDLVFFSPPVRKVLTLSPIAKWGDGIPIFYVTCISGLSLRSLPSLVTFHDEFDSVEAVCAYERRVANCEAASRAGRLDFSSLGA